ncbi:MAG: hypothetical protein OIF51_17910, partial [Cellvibrionaceae bacterium]|nr:hypothetical protein [Cellvibrionaceae bacterium]
EPHIVTLEDGGYLITWTSIDNNSGSTTVFGQRFNSNGEPFADVFEVGKVDGSFDANENALSQQAAENNNDSLLDLDESGLGFESLVDADFSQQAASGDMLSTEISPSAVLSSPLDWSSLLDGEGSAKELFEQFEVELPELEAAQFTTSSTNKADESPLDFYSSEQIAQELEQLLIIQTDIDIHP